MPRATCASCCASTGASTRARSGRRVTCERRTSRADVGIPFCILFPVSLKLQTTGCLSLLRALPIGLQTGSFCSEVTALKLRGSHASSIPKTMHRPPAGRRELCTLFNLSNVVTFISCVRPPNFGADLVNRRDGACILSLFEFSFMILTRGLRPCFFSCT